MNRYLKRHGILAMALVRNLPVAPYSLVNLIAGAVSIKLSDFLVGSFIGMLPGITVITLFTDRMLEAIENPNMMNIVLAVIVAILLAAGIWWLRKRLRQTKLPVPGNSKGE